MMSIAYLQIASLPSKTPNLRIGHYQYMYETKSQINPCIGYLQHYRQHQLDFFSDRQRRQ